jgi:PAS domain S-box-containing protein
VPENASDADDPISDPGRLAALGRCGRFGAGADETTDRYPRLISRHLGVPIAMVSAIYEDRQLYESAVGLPEPLAEAGEVPITGSVCKHVVRRSRPLAIEDLRTHPLVEDNPSVDEFGVVAYLGVPLTTREGHVLGTVCAFDMEARSWSEEDVEFMEAMAAAVMSEIQSGAFADEHFGRLDPEALLDPLVEGSLDGVLVMEPVYADGARGNGHGSEHEGEVEDFACRLVNEQGARILGHSREELLGTHIYDFFGMPKSEGHFAEYLRVMETGEPYHDTAHYDREDIHGWFDLAITPWSGGVIAHFHDVSEHKEAQEALREVNERFRFMAESLPQLVWTAGPDGLLDFVNQRTLDYFGAAEEDVLGEGWVAMVHPDDTERAIARWGQALEAGTPYDIEFRLRRADGTYLWHLTRALPQRGGGGEVTKWFGTCTDIEEKRQLEQELNRAREEAEGANKAKSQFLANMSHELRTPLNAVIGYSEMLAEDAEAGRAPGGSDEEGQEQLLADLDQIHSAGEQLLELVNDVLDISKIEAGQMELAPTTFEVEEMVRDAAATIRPLVEEGGNVFEVDCPAEVGAMHTDKTKLRQAIFNLLGNAAKFTEEGRVTLRVRRGEGENGGKNGRKELHFAVEDTGPGISAEDQKKLFHTFAQVDASLTRRHKGTGLGLVISQNLCQMMGGDITLESEKGVGSTFTVRLPTQMERRRGESEPGAEGRPATAGEEAPPETVSPDAKAPPPSDPLDESPDEEGDVVLVIDDDASARRLIKRRLEREGYVIRAASGGAEGLEAARALKPTVITLDVMMPDMDGWSVLSALKSEEDLRDIPVVMVTIVEERDLGYALGAADYLTKPLNTERLTGVIGKYRDDGGCSVLVIEDDEATREAARRTLETKGCTVRTAAHGRAGLDALEAPGYRPDAILLDLMMPEVDGFAFLEQMRRREDLSQVPVVVMTAKDLSAEDHERLNDQVDTVLQKGDYDREALLDELHRAVAGAVPALRDS